MNKFYDQKTSSSTNEDLPIAQLTIYADQDGLIYFACDWEDNPIALNSIADIFYKLDRKDLISEILIVSFFVSPPSFNNSGFFCSILTMSGDKYVPNCFLMSILAAYSRAYLLNSNCTYNNIPPNNG